MSVPGPIPSNIHRLGMGLGTMHGKTGQAHSGTSWEWIMGLVESADRVLTWSSMHIIAQADY